MQRLLIVTQLNLLVFFLGCLSYSLKVISYHSSTGLTDYHLLKHNALSTLSWWLRLISKNTKYCVLLCYSANTAKELTEVCGCVCHPSNGRRLPRLKSFLCCHPVCCYFSLLSVGLLIASTLFCLLIYRLHCSVIGTCWFRVVYKSKLGFEVLSRVFQLSSM